MKWSPWTYGKVESQNKQLSRCFRCYLPDAGNNWAKLVCKIAFAHKTSVNSSTGTTLYEIIFGFKLQITISLKLGLDRDKNDLCLSLFCQSLPNHKHVNNETSHSSINKVLSSESSMDLLNRESQFKNIYRKVYRVVREADHRALSYRSKYKLARPLRVRHKVLLENHIVPFGKSQKLCKLRSGSYIVTKVITKIMYQIALDADLTRTQFVPCNHFAEDYPRDNELANLLSNYEKAFNGFKTEQL